MPSNPNPSARFPPGIRRCSAHGCGRSAASCGFATWSPPPGLPCLWWRRWSRPAAASTGSWTCPARGDSPGRSSPPWRRPCLRAGCSCGSSGPRTTTHSRQRSTARPATRGSTSGRCSTSCGAACQPRRSSASRPSGARHSGGHAASRVSSIADRSRAPWSRACSWRLFSPCRRSRWSAPGCSGSGSSTRWAITCGPRRRGSRWSRPRPTGSTAATTT